ncbi:hypothetical protein K505DRAFT_358444 [Melanomma pulvis-pyrius CBS 109.77]|uniref:Uncharacterized protein n=1 Tax=Melanomma pulvis-pyrius CBS 109.77 TaxID=1314802 RepID=A0A6A6XM15_9PLEO|nr:hypothetical protein K505DRAFT_358444 [Melanomma pulvis-pyrius CBS 109.77]
MPALPISSKDTELGPLPPPILNPFFLLHNRYSDPQYLQRLLSLSQPPTLHNATLAAHYAVKIWRHTSVLCPAPPIVKVHGYAFYPSNAGEIEKLESYAVGNLKVMFVKMSVECGESMEEVEGRAIVYMGGQRVLEREIEEFRAERERRRRERNGLGGDEDEESAAELEGRIWGWLLEVQDGVEWEGEIEVDWDEVHRMELEEWKRWGGAGEDEDEEEEEEEDEDEEGDLEYEKFDWVIE